MICESELGGKSDRLSELATAAYFGRKRDERGRADLGVTVLTRVMRNKSRIVAISSVGFSTPSPGWVSVVDLKWNAATTDRTSRVCAIKSHARLRSQRNCSARTTQIRATRSSAAQTLGRAGL